MNERVVPERLWPRTASADEGFPVPHNGRGCDRCVVGDCASVDVSLGDLGWVKFTQE